MNNNINNNLSFQAKVNLVSHTKSGLRGLKKMATEVEKRTAYYPANDELTITYHNANKLTIKQYSNDSKMNTKFELNGKNLKTFLALPVNKKVDTLVKFTDIVHRMEDAYTEGYKFMSKLMKKDPYGVYESYECDYGDILYNMTHAALEVEMTGDKILKTFKEV